MAIGRRFQPDVPKLSGRAWEGDADRIVQEQLEWIREVFGGLPVSHGSTHMGGTDDLTGSGLPTEIIPGSPGSAGDSSHGFSPFDHEHPATRLAVLDDLEEVVGDMPYDGYSVLYVYDPALIRLMERAVLALEAIIGLDPDTPRR